jgi:hypothetical protein
MMKNRCNNKKAGDYPYYGGRGISYDKRWEHFEQFFADMGPKPNNELTLDRIDGDKNYSPENCKWATRKEQARNRRFIKRYRGKTVWEWAEELNLKPMSFHLRLWKLKKGMITEDQLYKPNLRGVNGNP